MISSNISPDGLISIWSVVPGTRAELCVKHEVVPAEMRYKPIAGGEIDPHTPFLRADMRRPVRDVWFKRVHDDLLSRMG